MLGDSLNQKVTVASERLCQSLKLFEPSLFCLHFPVSLLFQVSLLLHSKENTSRECF